MTKNTRCWLFLGLGISLAFTSLAVAHPPENGQHKPHATRNTGATSRSATQQSIPQNFVEFFSDLVLRCPTDLQPRLIDHLVDEHRFANNDPNSTSPQNLYANREYLLDQLQGRLHWLKATWTTDGVMWDQPPAPLKLANGATRALVVEIRNASEHSRPFRVHASGAPPGPAQLLSPQSSYPFLVEIHGNGSQAQVLVNDGTVDRGLDLPLDRVRVARLRVNLVDSLTGLPAAGRLWVEASDGCMHFAGPFSENRSFRQKPILNIFPNRIAAVPFFYADGFVEMELPPGPVKIRMERGFEYRVTESVLQLEEGDGKSVTMSCEPLVDAKSMGWVSGDTHIHWVTNAWNVDLPLPDLAMVQRAEGLRVANNLTLLHRNPDDAFIKPSQAPTGPVAKYSDQDFHMEMAEEYRNQNLYGHLCLLNLQWLVLPIGTGPDIAGADSLDYPINKTAILEARSQGGVSIEAHGTGANHELPQNAVHGLTDSLDQIDPVDYYRLLDCGFQLPLTNGSDHPARVAGCARAYVQIEGDFDYEKWIDGIRNGKTFTTSGPLIFLEINGQGPGAVLIPQHDKPVQATLRAISRFPLGNVQIVSNGEILKELQTDQNEVQIECSIPSDTSRWIVARCSRNGRWNALWDPDIAHTSAIYVHRNGESVFREQAANEWISRMRMHQRDILAKGRFANKLQREEAMQYTEEAIRRYQRISQIRNNSKPELPFEDRKDLLFMQASLTSGSPQLPELQDRLSQATADSDLTSTVKPLTLFRLHINPESRVKIEVVSPPEILVEHRTQRFLVEVRNEARVQSQLRLDAIDQSKVPAGHAPWFQLQFVENNWSTSFLNGQEIEWKLVDLCCSQKGHREVHVQVDAGQGTQDLGFRATADLAFRCINRLENRATLPSQNQAAGVNP